MLKPALRTGRICVSCILLVLLTSSRTNAQRDTADREFQDTHRWAQIFESPERAKWQRPEQVVSALKLEDGQTVVDIGAGTGYFTRRFAVAVARSGNAIGLDIEPGMIDYMKDDAKKLKLSNYEARLSKPDDPELAPVSVDVIFFCDVLHHVDDQVAYLKKVEPSLKPGGRVVVIDFKKTSPVGPPAAMRIPREKMIELAKKAAYAVLREHDFLPYQYFIEFEPRSPR